MAWFTAIVCLGVLAFFVFEHSERLPKGQRGKLRRWFLGWAIKGALFPLLIWVFFNLGLFDRLPALVMEIDLAPNVPARAAALSHVIATGLFAIATYWAALTAGWLLLALYRQSDLKSDMRSHLLSWSMLLGPAALLIWSYWGWLGAGLGGFVWLTPLLQVAHSLTPEPVRKPSYSRAVARMHFDKYEEAESAVIDELEKCEDDFDGWMLLAELYAVHFHDLPEAERTIRETCDQPATTDSQRSIALHKLADWRLKYFSDPAGARRDLEEICRTTANSHLAHMARLRLKQLPETREEFIHQQTAHAYHLPALRSDFDEPVPEETTSDAARDEAIFRARQLSEKLREDPNDVARREELARLLAERLGKVEAGLEQLELLLTIPNQPEKKLAEWLALLAAWNIKYKHNESAARDILERLLRQFPQSAPAFAAQRRLNLMDLEAKMRVTRSPASAPPKISILPG